MIFKLLGQFPYNEEFDFRFKKQTPPSSRNDNFQILPELPRKLFECKMLKVTIEELRKCCKKSSNTYSWLK